jgi:predicted phage terminase large subunit-like protein
LLRGPDDWVHLNLPAIAEQDESILIGEDKYYHRQAGDPLHTELESIEFMEKLREQVGTEVFAAQYQQCPILPDGAMIKRDWILRYDELPDQLISSCVIIQSWDTASKGGAENDWSVCTTWIIRDNKYYLRDVLRRRLEYPELKECALSHARLYKPNNIEDAGIGTALIRELKPGFTIVPVKPEGDKITRMAIQSAKFKSGQVFFPSQAPWLAEFEAELLTFPNSRHDDQVDSISQALAHSVPSFGWTNEALEGWRKLNSALWWAQQAPWNR